MGVRILDDRIEIAQPVAHRPRRIRRGEVIEDGFVVFVDQHHDPFPGRGMGLANQFIETARNTGLFAVQPQGLLIDGEQCANFLVQLGRIAHDPTAEAEPDDRRPPGPVPGIMNRQATEQGFIPSEKFPQGIEEQRFAETTRPGEEVMGALFDQPPGKRRLVDIVVIVLPDLLEGLDADG